MSNRNGWPRPSCDSSKETDSRKDPGQPPASFMARRCTQPLLYRYATHFVHAHMHPKVLTLAHASSHVSTIHTCVSSRPRLHSHTLGHPQHTARSQNPQVRTHYRCMRFTFSRAGLSRSNFLKLTSHAHSRGHTRHSFPVTFVHTQEGPSMSAPRPGPSGLRQSRRGAATS